MRQHEDEPTTIPNLKDVAEAERARKTTSPPEGYPAGRTQPQGGLQGDEGRESARREGHRHALLARAAELASRVRGRRSLAPLPEAVA